MLDELTIEHCRAWTKEFSIVYHAGVDAGYIRFSRNGVVFKKICDIYRETDGYWHADGWTPGAYTGPSLIALGFILLELNEPWDAEVRAGLEELQNLSEPVTLEEVSEVILFKNPHDSESPS